MKPLALDLCCGRGGWAAGFIAEGWRVVGVDFDERFAPFYPGQFVCCDLLKWEMWRVMSPALVLASPPCEEYSRWSMPWTRSKNPSVPDFRLWHRCEYIAKSLGVPLVLENVRGAQQFHGRSLANCGPFHLWGNGVPALVPVFTGKRKESYGSQERARRAEVSFHLSSWLARVHRPLASCLVPVS